MTATMKAVLASEQLWPLRNRLRSARDRWVDQPLSQIERARRRLAEGDVDVLVLGDSSCMSWAPGDIDRTLLPELIGRKLGSQVVTVAGPAFNPRLYAEILRILSTMKQRPRVVVATLATRPSFATHMLEHPIYGYARSYLALADVTAAHRRIRSIGRGGVVANPSDYDKFYALPMHTRWGGDFSIGAFRKRLKGQGLPPWPPELERFRFDYFHGECADGHPALAHASEFGRQIENYGVPAAIHWTKPPLQRGESHFPGEFERHVRSNLAVVESAILSATTSLAPLVQTDLDDADFEDSQNATEHYSFRGREKIADAIDAALNLSR